MGRVRVLDKWIDKRKFEWMRDYDQLGRVAMLTYPDAATIRYSYDGTFLKSWKYLGPTCLKSRILRPLDNRSQPNRPLTFTLNLAITTPRPIVPPRVAACA